MIAYFLGGSWDLTKLQLRDCAPRWEISIAPRLSIGESPLPGDIQVRRESYRRIHHDSEKDVAIYLHEE